MKVLFGLWRAADSATPGVLSRMHRLQLGVTTVELFQRSHGEELTVDAKTEQRDGGIDQAVDVEGVRVLGGTVGASVRQVTFEEAADVVGPRVVDRDLADGHGRS